MPVLSDYKVGQIVRLGFPSGYGIITEVKEDPIQFHRNGHASKKLLYRRGGLVIDHHYVGQAVYPIESKSFHIEVVDPISEILKLRGRLEEIKDKQDIEFERQRYTLEQSIKFLEMYAPV